jgi:hypothetical protein
MQTFSTSLKIIPKALAIKIFSNAMKAAAQRRSQIVKVLPKGVLPLVTSQLPQVSAVPEKGLVSGKPLITIPRYWGWLPSRKWPRTGLPARHIRAIYPVEISTFGLLTRTFFFWAQPALAIAAIADDIREQSEKERTEEGRVNSELLELKMSYEMDEISEQDYKIEEARFKKKLKDIREGSKSSGVIETPGEKKKRAGKEKKRFKKK